MTRIQINALIDGQVAASSLGPHLLQRLGAATNAAGRQPYMLQVVIVEDPLVCPRCGSHSLHRLERRGFWQSRVLPLFGLYPWNCIDCRRSCVLMQRNGREITAAAQS